MPQTDLYTMVFKKNGKLITKANGGDIIDVELYSTDPAFDTLQKKEIFNFQFDVVNGDNLSFSNCTYVNDSITNSLGIVPLPDQYKDLPNEFLRTHVGVTRGLTKTIKFKIKLQASHIFKSTTAIVKAKGNGFNFSNGNSNIEKKIYLTIKPKIGPVALFSILMLTNTLQK